MNSRDDDRFRPKVGPPRSKGRASSPRFVNRVLKVASTVGPMPPSMSPRPSGGGRHARGHVAARMHAGTSTAKSRRVIIKTRLVNLKHASPRSVAKHLAYMQRDGVTREGGAGVVYGRDAEV